jgi:hypothetical protein
MKHTLRSIILIAVLSGCQAGDGDQSEAKDRPPLADTLMAILTQLGDAARGNEADRFIGLLDSSEAERLRELTARQGFHSLRGYLQYQFACWPDPDTLIFTDLVEGGPYARLALSGAGVGFGRRGQSVRYTFALFKKSDTTWRLAAVSSLEKPRFDSYGTEQDYFETELPPKLRFPRLF